MSKSDEFRQYAEEAMRWARQSKTENDGAFHMGKDKPRRLNIMNERIATRETTTSVAARKLNSDSDMAARPLQSGIPSAGVTPEKSLVRSGALVNLRSVSAVGFRITAVGK
jgi:hypothetical protein